VFVHKRPQFDFDIAIFAGEVRVDRKTVIIREGFRLLAGFGQQKFCDFQRRFSPRLGSCGSILDDPK
jgi:hypothetical protein